MPTTVKKVGKNKYRVSTPSGTKAKATTKEKAKKQKRLLDAIDHGFEPDEEPVKKRAKSSGRKKGAY